MGNLAQHLTEYFGGKIMSLADDLRALLGKLESEVSTVVTTAEKGTQEAVTTVEASPIYGNLVTEVMTVAQAFAKDNNLSVEHVVSAVLDHFFFGGAFNVQAILKAVANRPTPAPVQVPNAVAGSAVNG